MSDKFVKIGNILQAARMEQKRALTEIAEETRIMIKHLKAIESGDPKSLPSTAYFMLFARNYGQFLGIDPVIFDEIANGSAYEANGKDDPGSLISPEEAENISQDQSSRFLKSLVTIIVIAILLFAAVLAYDRFFVEKSDSANLEIPDIDTMITHAPEEIRIDSDSGKLVVPAYQPPAPLKLQLTVIQDVWAYISRDGEKIVDRELKIGEVYNWEAKRRFRFSLGISTAIEMVVNGRKLAPLSKTPQVISALEINQVNYADYYPAPVEEITIIKTIEPDTIRSDSGGSDGN